MADDPTRLRVMARLTEVIERVQIANGYKHDLHGKVFRGRLMFGEKDPVPMVSILEVPVPMEQVEGATDNPARTGPWELIVQGFAEDDYLHPTDPAHRLAADVIQALAEEKRDKGRDFKLLDMGDTVLKLNIGVYVCRPPDELSSKAYFWLPLKLTLAEQLDKPYAD